MRAILRSGGLGALLTVASIAGSVFYTSRNGPLFGHWDWADMSAAVLLIVVMLVLSVAFNAGGRPTGFAPGSMMADAEMRGRVAKGSGPSAMFAEPKHELMGWASNIIVPFVAMIVLLVLF